MKTSKLLTVILLYTFSVMFFPWKDRAIFLWDDIEFLMQLRHFSIPAILEVHEYQFHPLFNLTTWMRIQFSGVNIQSFLLTSIFLHLINIILLFRIVEVITRSQFFALIAAILAAFNKSYFTVVYWLAVHSNIMVTTTLLLVTLLFLYAFKKNTIPSSLFFVSLTAAPLFQGFGIGAGFIFALITICTWPVDQKIWRVLQLAVFAGICSLFITIPFIRGDMIKSQTNQFSISRVALLSYFTAIGVSQALMTKFAIPGFIPDVFNSWNILMMITIPFLFLIFFVSALYKLRHTRGLPFLGILIGLAFSISPYFIAGIGRSAHGALGGLAERYIYVPFFFFVIACMSALHAITQHRLTKTKKILITFLVLIVSFGHQITMFKELGKLFV